MVIHAVVDESRSPTSPLGDAIDTFLRREDAEQSIANVRRDDPQLAAHRRAVERELEASGRNCRTRFTDNSRAARHALLPTDA
jgi:hypothetical protein